MTATSATTTQKTARRLKPSYKTAGDLQALWVLSGFSGQVSGKELSDLIGEAPDPETACRIITRRMRVPSDTLTAKWRKLISQTWHDQHPQASHIINLPLSSQEVAETIALRDAHAFLHALEQQPAALTTDHEEERLLHPDELDRFLKTIPSLRNRPWPAIEHEWACVPLHRLRTLLQELRLIRVYNGQLVPVRSRLERFQELPLPQQYYALWHADVYHVDWSAYAHGWKKYIKAAQDYVPLLWELGEDVNVGHTEDIHDVSYLLLDIFTEAWEQEGLLDQEGNRTFLDIYQQSTLPGILQRLIIDDLFARYGLVESMDVVNVFLSRHGQAAAGSTAIEWTSVGHTLLQAEGQNNLPCGLDILS